MSLTYIMLVLPMILFGCDSSTKNQDSNREIPFDSTRNAEVQEIEKIESSGDVVVAEDEAVATEDPVTAELTPWYPAFQEGMCKDDGNGPNDVVPTTTYQICCKRFMPLTEQDCNAKSGPNPTPWYPKFTEGRCKADGDGPDNVLHTKGHEECCFRFFPASEQECIDASPGG